MALSRTTARTGARVCVRDLTYTYRVDGIPRPALVGISLDVRPGEFLSIIGPSGCGKSTLLRLVAGLLSVQHGEVMIDGAPPRAAQRDKALGIVFQDPALLPWRTVEANIRLPLELNRAGRTGERVAELLDLVGLRGFGRYYPHQLSGGMQQRVALARALATDPPLLLMDEPFAALDDITRTELRLELCRITEQTGKTVLFVTHSVAEAVLLSDRVVVMSGAPGAIRAVVAIDLPRPRPADSDTSPAFAEHVRRLRTLLWEGAARTPAIARTDQTGAGGEDNEGQHG
jgi:NitT/TauT family transport system ATP-binding protein